MTPPPVVAASKEGIANPAPLGLCAFGTTTVLLNLHNAGLFEMSSVILAMGIFYGGIAQVIAGIIEAKKNNTFGFDGLYFLWIILAVAGRYSRHAKNGMGRCSVGKCHGCLPGWLGGVHFIAFLRNFEAKPGPAICVCYIDHPVFPVGHWRLHRQGSIKHVAGIEGHFAERRRCIRASPVC